MEKIDAFSKKCEYLGKKKDPFFQNRGHADPFSVKFRTMMRTITRVAGPGTLCPWKETKTNIVDTIVTITLDQLIYSL